MSSNPVNLAVRFILELVALYALGYWGWTQHDGFLRFVWAVALPLFAAILWGTFRAPDPAHPVKIPVHVPGIVRLILEFFIFGGATWAFYAAGKPGWALFFGLVLIGHYILSYDRILILLKQP
ncbi:YrdB family protein [Chloroflexota bacterium]